MASYYRRFVPQFSKIAAPLHKLLKKDAKFMWGQDQEVAFSTLKQKLTSKPILQYPNFSEEFILTTDASNDGAGAVLSQGEIGKDLPIVLQVVVLTRQNAIIVQLNGNWQLLCGELSIFAHICTGSLLRWLVTINR